VILGVFFSFLKIKPIEIIKFAQIANGILLPVIVIFLFWVASKASVWGEYRNSKLQNLLSIIVIAITVFLGIKSILNVFQNI
jgi:Mn2+/Fe2+ NRAMP family transporter